MVYLNWALTSMGPIDPSRFFNWYSVVDVERPSMDTVRRWFSASLWVCLAETGRPRPTFPLPLPRPDTTTCTSSGCKNWNILVKNIRNRKPEPFLSFKGRMALGLQPCGEHSVQLTCFFLRCLSAFHQIDSSHFYIKHQCQNMMRVTWCIFIRMRGRFPWLQRKKTKTQKRGGRGNMVCARVQGREHKREARWRLPYTVGISECAICDRSLAVTGVQRPGDLVEPSALHCSQLANPELE